MKTLIQIASIVLLLTLSFELSGISDLFFSTDSCIELYELEDADKKEKDEKEEESKLFGKNLLEIAQGNLAKEASGFNMFKIPIHFLGIDTPPPELI